MEKNERLTNLKLNHDETGYYLEATYEYDTDSGRYKKVYPHINLLIYEKSLPKDSIEYFRGAQSIQTVDLGFGECIVQKVETIIPKTNNHDSETAYCSYYVDLID